MNTLVVNRKSKEIADAKGMAKVVLPCEHLKDEESFGFDNSLDAYNFIVWINDSEAKRVDWRKAIQWAKTNFRMSELWARSRQRKGRQVPVVPVGGASKYSR